jgi:hypothetical protein
MEQMDNGFTVGFNSRILSRLFLETNLSCPGVWFRMSPTAFQEPDGLLENTYPGNMGSLL